MQSYLDDAGWEPPPRSPSIGPHGPPPDPPVDVDNNVDRPEQRAYIYEQLSRPTHITPFPEASAGAPLPDPRAANAYEAFQSSVDNDANLYAPFVSRLDWEFARWAKMRGPGSTAVSELLSIEEIPALLGLSFKNSQELNAIIDTRLVSGRPRFIRREIVVADEAFDVFYRDIISCVRALFGDPEFTSLLVFTPERHYADVDRTHRVYFDMHTGKWWWRQQKEMERRNPGATIIPIIIASDKTQLTLFGSKTAYPVYLTIGNLPKDIRRKPSRRGQILLAYLPNSSLSHITSKAARRRAISNLYHVAMSRIMRPLRSAGIDGISLASGDGIWRRGHPIFAVHVGDYLEQILVAGCKMGECPKCPIPPTELGESTDCDRPLRDFRKVVEALQTVDEGPRAFARACREAGIKPIQEPFWANLPFVNVYQAITPDVLHQLSQGVIKHIISWIISAYGADEIDARCRRFPPNHHIRLFLKGVSKLQRVTGNEHADMCRFLLGLIIGLPLPNGASSVDLAHAVRALLDFFYLAQYPAHTDDTLDLLRTALQDFHNHKHVFIALGIRAHFRLPKLHSLDHYVLSITLFGTTDNYDTQYTERLHIDFAKEAYRSTNKKDEFPQMTLWLERREKILRHDAYVRWRCGATVSSPSGGNDIRSRIRITRSPSVKSITLAAACGRYGADFLQDALARFVVRFRDPRLPTNDVEAASIAVRVRPNWRISTFHKIRFVLEDAQRLGVMEDLADVAHARPERRDRRGRHVPGRFDTVLVKEQGDGMTGLRCYRVGRVRILFKLRKGAADELFGPAIIHPGHLAYVEWFTAFTQPGAGHCLHHISRCRGPAGERLADVIELRKMRRSCHLFPDFGNAAPRDWTSSTVLDLCDEYFFNVYSDRHMYMSA
ncbi:hypothetical protein C8Q77DRAFT_1052098 [Trametes polyzona]|nr:hypothetical protein C8Q77DRAFT_1052098 [Trametes polyzona]